MLSDRLNRANIAVKSVPGEREVAASAAASRPSYRELIFTLISLSNLMRSNQECFATYIGVNVPQYLALRTLEDAPDTTVGQIAARLEVSSQFVTIEIGKLLERGLVEKRPNEADRRSVLLSLTAAGRTLMREVEPIRREANDFMFRSLSGEQALRLGEILGTVLADGRAAHHELEAPNRRDQRAPSIQLKVRAESGAQRAARSRSGSTRT
jgi:MarR family transcriptional regulator, organic hydroperoxide resistance regulator